MKPSAIEWLKSLVDDKGKRRISVIPRLNSLEQQVTACNQDLKAAEARFRAARALVLTCKTPGIWTRDVESFRLTVVGLCLLRCLAVPKAVRFELDLLLQ